jgi:hypothetical protein
MYTLLGGEFSNFNPSKSPSMDKSYSQSECDSKEVNLC